MDMEKETFCMSLIKKQLLDITPPNSPPNDSLFHKLYHNIFVTSESDLSSDDSSEFSEGEIIENAEKENAEKENAEKQNAERQNAERQNAERQNVERQKMERQNVEKQNVEKQNVEKQNVEKQNVEKENVEPQLSKNKKDDVTEKSVPPPSQSIVKPLKVDTKPKNVSKDTPVRKRKRKKSSSDSSRSSSADSYEKLLKEHNDHQIKNRHKDQTTFTDNKKTIKLEKKDHPELSSRPLKKMCDYSDTSSESDRNNVDIEYDEKKDITDFEQNVIQVKQETENDLVYGNNIFKCDVCRISMNSQNTLASHKLGKKHLKALKAKNVTSVAQLSLEEKKVKVPNVFSSPKANANLISLRGPSKIDRVLKEIIDVPLMELQQVHEIRGEAETRYYCKLCGSSCTASSIIPHLKGFTHLKMCFELYLPHVARRANWNSRKDMNKDLGLLLREEAVLGRGTIQVFQEVPMNSQFEAGPSRRYYEENNQVIPVLPDGNEFLDMSKSDYHCKLCDSHMNNSQMWESHISGKRHLKNMKKNPGDGISKAKFMRVAVRSKLEEKLSKSALDYPVVGLDFIRETQNVLGLQYNCYLCGACCTALDIEDHLALTKHMQKYLEKKKESSLNLIHTVNVSASSRENLIIDLCEQEVDAVGSGTVEVYVPVNKS